MLDNLRSKRNDLHKSLVAQLARKWPEHARPDRFADFIDQHGRIRIEADVRPVFAARLLPHPDYDAADHFALLDIRVRRSFLNRSGNDIAQTRAKSQVAAAGQDALQLARAAVVGHLQHGSHSDHDVFSLKTFAPSLTLRASLLFLNCLFYA